MADIRRKILLSAFIKKIGEKQMNKFFTPNLKEDRYPVSIFEDLKEDTKLKIIRGRVIYKYDKDNNQTEEVDKLALDFVELDEYEYLKSKNKQDRAFIMSERLEIYGTLSTELEKFIDKVITINGLKKTGLDISVAMKWENNGYRSYKLVAEEITEEKRLKINI